MTHPVIVEYAKAECDIGPCTVITQSFTSIADQPWQLEPLKEGMYLGKPVR